MSGSNPTRRSLLHAGVATASAKPGRGSGAPPPAATAASKSASPVAADLQGRVMPGGRQG